MKPSTPDMKEINFKFQSVFIHMRTNGKIYRVVIDNYHLNKKDMVHFDLSNKDFKELSLAMSRLKSNPLALAFWTYWGYIRIKFWSRMIAIFKTTIKAFSDKASVIFTWFAN